MSRATAALIRTTLTQASNFFFFFFWGGGGRGGAVGDFLPDAHAKGPRESRDAGKPARVSRASLNENFSRPQVPVTKIIRKES